MQNNISRQDLDELITYLQSEDPRLTQGDNVLEFEKAWSEWLGVRYSVFVNSGSSANLISLAVLRELNGIGEVIVPPLTWVSDIVAVLKNGFTPVFVDINPRTLAMDTSKVIDNINESTRAVFLTHAQGFNGLTDELCYSLSTSSIPLIEDVCESHGGEFRGKKLGTFGLMSNFSFYFAHHMSTIEGGMVCSNDEKIYQMLRMFRSHGLVRESSDASYRREMAVKNPELNPEFIFAYQGYNVRNTEIGAVIGRSQINRLDQNNIKRKENFRIFLGHLDESRFRTDYEIEGSCNYAFNIVLKTPDCSLRDRIESAMAEEGIEYRRGSAGGGNQMRQPYLKGIVQEHTWLEFPEVEHVHHFGWYVGNFPDMDSATIKKLCRVINSA